MDERRRMRALDAVRKPHRPTARLVVEPDGAPRRIAVVSGAFHPPTLAHRALARAALRAGADAALFALGTVTLDKKESGMPLAERLELLADLADEDPRLGVVVHNAGLYADQAVAIRRTLTDIDELAFVVGMDKLPQLLDPRYYEDVERGLETLFANASLWVAPRGSAGRKEFLALRSREPARRHLERIRWMPLSPRWRSASATDVREALARGDREVAWLPARWLERLRENRSSTSGAERPRSRRSPRTRRRAPRPRRPASPDRTKPRAKA